MNKLLSYYQRELAYLKNHGKKFSISFPKIARRLGISEGVSEDPHIERLIESFALLTAQIHQRLDDDMPELEEAMLTIIAPQFLRSMPSTCIVSIEPDPVLSGITGENIIAEGATLYSKPINSTVCSFRTVYPVILLPLTINDAKLFFDKNNNRWNLRFYFEVWAGSAIKSNRLRLYLHGQENAVNIMYTLLASEIYALKLHQDNQHILLQNNCFRAVGFQSGEELAFRDPRIPPIHMLLQEFFCFPQKFHFLDLMLPEQFSATDGDKFEVEVVFNHTYFNSHLEQFSEIVDHDFFRLHCSPAINLFALHAEPITLSDNTAEYPVIPDIRKSQYINVWSIDTVNLLLQEDRDVTKIPVHPLLGIARSRSGAKFEFYWQNFQRTTVTASGVDNHMFISFANCNGALLKPNGNVVSINLTCTNDTLPHSIKNGDPNGDFDSELPIAGLKISALRCPTLPIQPPVKSSVRWQLISQLALNHMPMNGPQGAQILRETLMLYNFQNAPDITRILNTIQHVDARPIVSRLVANDPCSLARGVSLTVTFSQSALDYPEYYLLCCFLDHFLALYAPVNSFTRVTTLVEHAEHSRRIWPLRAGRLSWL